MNVLTAQVASTTLGTKNNNLLNQTVWSVNITGTADNLPNEDYRRFFFVLMGQDQNIDHFNLVILIDYQTVGHGAAWMTFFPIILATF
jgi:hypothetical protein